MVLPLDQSEQLAGYGVYDDATPNAKIRQLDEAGQINTTFSFCDKLLECGHTCRGVEGEAPCVLPCLKEECQ